MSLPKLSAEQNDHLFRVARRFAEAGGGDAQAVAEEAWKEVSENIAGPFLPPDQGKGRFIDAFEALLSNLDQDHSGMHLNHDEVVDLSEMSGFVLIAGVLKQAAEDDTRVGVEFTASAREALAEALKDVGLELDV